MGQINYAASKAGVIGLTQSVALELGRLVRHLGVQGALLEYVGALSEGSVCSPLQSRQPLSLSQTWDPL